MFESKSLKGNLTKLLLIALCLALTSCSKQSKKESEILSFEQLKKQSDDFIERRKKDFAIESLEKMMELYPDNHESSSYSIKLADLYFSKGSYKPAEKFYKRFCKHNPSDPNVEFASYRTILCKFYQTFGIKRDPTNIQKALNHSIKHLEKPSFKNGKYAGEVKDIHYTCEKMLIDREIYIHKNYVRRGKYKSAQNRLNYLHDKFASKHPELQEQLLYLEAHLAYHQKNIDLAKGKLQLLAEKYPDSQFTENTRKILGQKKTPFLF